MQVKEGKVNQLLLSETIRPTTTPPAKPSLQPMQCLSEANAGFQKENTRMKCFEILQSRNMLGLGFLLRNKVLQTSTYFVNPVSVWGEGYQLIQHATLG